jgi:hypothetical protein
MYMVYNDGCVSGKMAANNYFGTLLVSVDD